MSVLAYKLTATIWKEPEGYVARCSELGVASAGDSPSEAFVNLKEATELYLENMILIGELIPIKPFLQVFS
jgi:predicted RNase H-like HicB family nuclease